MTKINLNASIDDDIDSICRDDACPIKAIHAKHDRPVKPRGRRPRKCPTCREKLVKIEGTSSVRCNHCSFVYPTPI